MPVALITDSTASLPADVAAAHQITVVPLQVVIGSEAFEEGSPEVSAEILAAAMSERVPVSTSRPSPGIFAEAYAAAAAAGATHILSVHLSSELSGTFESAQLAARTAEATVHCLDSRQVGMGLGFAVLAAAEAVERGADAVEAAQEAQRVAATTTSLFYVDTLEYLRRGGRIGAAAALVGSALAVKPILGITDGKIVPVEKVRTASRALARLADLSVEAAEGRAVALAVAHLAAQERADDLAAILTARLPDAPPVMLGETGAVLGAHVGPGMVSVAVAPRQ